MIEEPLLIWNRWFALVRSEPSWLIPRQGKATFALREDAVLCSFLNPEGRHLVLLAVSGINNILTVLQSNDAGRVVLHIRNDSAQEETATVIAAVGDCFDNANAAVMYHARTLTYSQSMDEKLGVETAASQGDFKAQWLQEWHDGLGFCQYPKI